MKLVQAFLMLLLPAGLLAGAWTGANNAQHGEASFMLVIAHKVLTGSLTMFNALTRITEPAGLLLLGTSLVLMAWLLHRLRGRTGA